MASKSCGIKFDHAPPPPSLHNPLRSPRPPRPLLFPSCVGSARELRGSRGVAFSPQVIVPLDRFDPSFLTPVRSQPGVPMTHLHGVVQQLKAERELAQKQVQRIDEALAALGGGNLNGASRTMSAAGRRRISLAQKARWAKQRASKPKRTISAAGRRRIAAAQRARWARVKRAT